MEKTSYWAKNDLSLLFLLSIFMNGFETGGYQACLLYVGQEYDLSIGQQGMLAAVQLFATVFVFGFFCGGVYPNVLTYVADFAGGRTATVTAAITVATGIGATVISASFGFFHEQFGFNGAFLVLAALLGVDILIAAMVPRLQR